MQALAQIAPVSSLTVFFWLLTWAGQLRTIVPSIYLTVLTTKHRARIAHGPINSTKDGNGVNDVKPRTRTLGIIHVRPFQNSRITHLYSALSA